MFLRSAAVLAALAGSVALGAPHASAATGYRAHWTLDEVSGTTVADSSGNGNTGTSYHTVGASGGYTFNGTNARVIVPSAAVLNPGAADFSFGVTLTMTTPPARNETYDVLRKGLVTTKGGDYKLEVKNAGGKAVARCVSRSFRANGTKILATIQSAGKTLADGTPHVVTCTKTSNSISIQVDTRALRTNNYSSGLGSVSNTSELALGAKAESTAQTGFDWYDGVISDAWVA